MLTPVFNAFLADHCSLDKFYSKCQGQDRQTIREKRWMPLPVKPTNYVMILARCNCVVQQKFL
jgi:hypothetical protein